MSFNENDYYLHHIEVSNKPQKKYTAILKKRDDQTQEIKVDFGNKTKNHFKDRTGLNAYPNQNKGRFSDKKAFKDSLPSGPLKLYSEQWLEKVCLH